jgi:hypothetical protein
MARHEVLGVAEARKLLPELLADIRRGSCEPVFLGSHRRVEGVLLSADVYDELRGSRKRAVDDAVGSLHAEGLRPSSVASDLAQRYAEGQITAAQMEAMLLAYHRAA